MQCNQQMTPKPVEKGQHRGWLVPMTINQVATMALLDTGATCTMIGRPLYELLQAAQPLKVRQDENLRLEVIRGGVAPTLGTATVQIGIAGGSYEHEIVISANRENPNCILSSDFSSARTTANCQCADSSSRWETVKYVVCQTQAE